jgi:hypothetical protein
MGKKRIFWVIVALVAFLGQGCNQPISLNLKIKTENLGYSFRTVIGNADLLSIFNAILGKDISPDLKLYDMVNYKGSQAFLAAYEVEMIDSFNPNDYLQEINLDLEKQPIKAEFSLPQITQDMDVIEHQVYWFSMSELLDGINIGGGGGSGPLPFALDKAEGSLNVLSGVQFPVMNLGGSEEFNSVIIGKGSVKLTITIAGDVAASNATVTLKGIGLKSGGKFIDKSFDAELDKLNNEKIIIINLEDAEIFKNNLPQLVIDKVEYKSPGQLPSPLMPPLTGTLEIKSELIDPVPRGAKGLKIDKAISQKLKEDITIAFNTLPNGFINAKIKSGSFTIDVKMPSIKEGEKLSEKLAYKEKFSYMEGAEISYTIAVEQKSHEFDHKDFKGLDITVEKDAKLDNNELWINREDLTVIADGVSEKTFITIGMADSSKGIDFVLYDDDCYSRLNNEHQAFSGPALPVLVKMGIILEDLELVRWKTEDENNQPYIILPTVQVDFCNIGGKDISAFIEEITFNEIIATIDFTQGELPDALREKLALKPNCPEFGFKPADYDYELLADSTDFKSGSFTLYSSDNEQLDILLDYVPIVPIGNPDNDTSPRKPVEGAKYMELGPLTMNKTGFTTLEINGLVSFEFDWEEAKINLKNLSEIRDKFEGSFPKAESPLDLSVVTQYMKGFTFADADVEVLLGGPASLIQALEPHINLVANYQISENDEDDWENYWLLENTAFEDNNVGNLFSVFSSNSFTDGKGKNTYYGTTLPDRKGATTTDKSQGFIKEVIQKFPKSLYFNYKMKFSDDAGDSITIKNEEISEYGEDGGNYAIKALFMLKLPLKLVAGPDAFFQVPNDNWVEKDNNGDIITYKDLFGRASKNGLTPDVVPGSDEDPFKDVNLKEVRVSIEFEGNFFKGAVLHIDRKHRLFGESGLSLNNAVNNKLEIPLTGADVDIIRQNIIEPDIKINFPPKVTLAVPRNCVPLRISFSAKGDYTQKIDL